MSPRAVIGLGAHGLEAVANVKARALARGEAPAVLAIAEAGQRGAAVAVGPAITHTVQEYNAIELPPLPRPLPPASLAPLEIVSPARASSEALVSAIEKRPAWLPQAIAADLDDWIERVERRDVPPRIAVRLLWPRAAKAVTRSLQQLARSSPGGALIVGDPAEPLTGGLLLELLAAAAAVDLTVVACLLASTGGEQAALAELVDEYEAGTRRRPPLVILAERVGVGVVDALAQLPDDSWVVPDASYRGRPLACGAVRHAVVERPAAMLAWHLRRRAVAVTLERMTRAVGDTEAAAGAARGLLARVPLPDFAAGGVRPASDLLRSIAPVVFAIPGGAVEHPAAARRSLDGRLLRRREEIADRELRLDREIGEWLQGGKLSLVGGTTASGLRGEVTRAVAAELGARGIDGGRALLAAVEAELGAGDEGEAAAQLAQRVSQLEEQRSGFRIASKSGSFSLGGLLKKADGEERERIESSLTGYARLLSELVRADEGRVIAGAVGELYGRALAFVRELGDGLERLRVAAGAVRQVIDALPPSCPSGALLDRLLAEVGFNAGGLLLRAADADAVARWSATPQQMLDDLWRAVDLGDDLERWLADDAPPGPVLRRRLEDCASAWRRERLPHGLHPPLKARLVAPTDEIAREVAAHLPFASDLVATGHDDRRSPIRDEIAVICLEIGLPASALAALPEVDRGGAAVARLADAVAEGEVGLRDVRDRIAEARALVAGADPYLDLLAATIGAATLRELTLAESALSSASDLERGPHGEEVAAIVAIAPLVMSLRKADEVDDPSYRLPYLEDARRHLDGWGELAEAALVEPERSLARAAAACWSELLATEMAACRGRAEIRLELRTRRLGLTAGSTRIEVAAASSGAVSAENVAVSLKPSAAFRLLGEGRVELGRLACGASSVASFRVKPASVGTIAVELTAHFDDLVAKGHRAELAAEVEIYEAPVGFRRIASNPYIAGPPVKTDRMFYGRDDVFRFVRDNLHGRYQSNVLILHGNRRTGKSSILGQLERGTLVSPWIPVYLDVQGLGRLTTASFFAQLARRVVRSLRGHGVEPPEPPDRAALRSEDAFDVMNDFLDEIHSIPFGAPRMLVMLDEYEILEDGAVDGRVDRELFGWLRSLMQHGEEMVFLLAGTHRLSELDEEIWAPLQALALYRHVGFLSEAETRSLVTEPVVGEIDFDDLAVEAILRLTGGHPYYAQLLCQLLVNHLNERERANVVTLDDLAVVTEAVLRAGGGQFVHEWRTPRAPASRLALAALAEAADTAGVWIELEEVRRRSGLDADAAARAARELRDRDLVLAFGDAYRIRVDLLRQWLRRERPVARARAELEQLDGADDR